MTQPQFTATLRRVAQRGAEDMVRGVWAKRFVKAVRAEGGNMAMSDMRDPLHPTLVTRGDFSPSLLAEVRAMGVPIVEQEPGEETRYGHWIGAIIEPSGRRMGATTNAFSGHAEGY